MKRNLVIVALLGLVIAAMARNRAHASDTLYACGVLGADAGSTMVISSVYANSQFMVSASVSGITTPTLVGMTYRACVPYGTDGGPPCTATSTDAPVPAGAQVDLCEPTGYTQLGFYKAYDGGNPTVCVYRVNPKTVCQINTP